MTSQSFTAPFAGKGKARAIGNSSREGSSKNPFEGPGLSNQQDMDQQDMYVDDPRTQLSTLC